MPQYQLVDNETGRELLVESDSPPTEAEVSRLFQNHDAFKVAIAGPKGSEGRRRAMAQEVAGQQEASTSDESSTLGRIASAGQSFMRAGGQMAGQAISELTRVGDSLAQSGVMVGPGGGVAFSNPELVRRFVEESKRTPLEREQQIQQDPLYQAGVDISTGAKLAYQPNPKYKGEFFADVIPSSAGAMVPTIATGLAAGPAAAGALYGLSAGQQAAEDAIAAGRPETAQTSSLANLPIGALSEFGLGAAANVGKLARLGVQRGALVAGGRAAGGEAIQEGVEQVGGNLIASDVAGYDPNRGAFEGVPQAMAAGALLGGVIGGASAKIAQANTTPDLLAGLSEKWKAIGLARELNTLTPVGGVSQPPPLIQGGFPQAQLDLSERNSPPQFQMVTSEAPRTARPLLRSETESGLRDQVEADGRTPIDQFLSKPTQAQPAAGQLAQLEQSRQAQFPAGGAAVNPEQPQSIQLQGDLMESLRDARKMDVLRQPSPMSAAQLGTGQPAGGPPASNDLTPFLLAYEARGQAPAQVAVAPGKWNGENIGDRPVTALRLIDGTILLDPAAAIHAQAFENLGVDPTTVMDGGFVRGDEYKTSGSDTGRIVRQANAAKAIVTKRKSVNLRAKSPKPAQPLSRSEPAAAQGIATEGAGVSQEETPAFGVRRYGDALFISIAQYNRLRPLVDERLAAGDETAKRINDIEINAEQEAAKAAGFGALTPEGQVEAVDGFKTKLYQSAAKWLAGGEFEFSSPVIAKSIAMDIGKSKAERMRKATQSGESSEEGGEEIRGAFEKVSDATLPKAPLKAPPKVKEEIILSMVNLQRQLNATKTQFANVMMAYKDPSFEENLDDDELGMLEKSRPMLGRLDNIRYSVADRGPTGFTTEMGSTYAIDKNGNTTRFKRSPGKGQNQTHKAMPVVFVGQKAIDVLAVEGVRIVLVDRNNKQVRPKAGDDLRGKVLGVAAVDRKTGKVIGQIHATETSPRAGVWPLEIVYDGEQKTTHVGNRIVSVDGAAQNSVSSLIAEPIGQARAQQAVDKWRLETGATEARIQVVDDPELTTPDGRPVAAMVETRPGELPIITINAAHIASEEEVREKLWHEALHPVWNDPSVQKAWGDVVNSLPRGAVEAETARGYSPLEATMEAAINSASVRANNTKVRTAWQKFLDEVWAAMGKVFGFDTKPKDFEQLMESALQSLSRPYNQAPSTQYAGQLTQRDAEYLAAVQRGDMEAAQRMVDEAANRAGYNVGPLYRGHDASRNVYDTKLITPTFSESRRVAELYAADRDNPTITTASLKIQNPLSFGDESGAVSIMEFKELLNKLVAKAYSVEVWYDRIGKNWVSQIKDRQGNQIGDAEYSGAKPSAANSKSLINDYAKNLANKIGSSGDWMDDGNQVSYDEASRFSYAESYYIGDNSDFNELAKAAGHDGYRYRGMFVTEDVLENGQMPEEVRPFHQYQIKSADPVTYDDSGAIIPPSKRFNPSSPDIRYSVANSFVMTRSPEEIQQRLETSSDPESLLAMGKGAASLITPEFQELVKSVEDAKPGTAEAAMRTYLKRAAQLAQTGEAVVEWGQTHETPIPAFKSIGDLPAEWQGVVGNAMTGAHFALGQQVKSIDRAIEKTAGELTVVGADFSEADEKRLVAEATRSEAKRLLKDLLKLIEIERNKLGTSSVKATGAEVAKAAQMVGRVDRGLIAALANGIEIMAREMPIGGFASNEEALKWLVERQSKNPIFGDKAMEAYNALTKALERKPDQTKRIEQIRALTLDNVDAVRQVGELSKLLGKNKANTIKTYAKLRADYESAFRQFKGLSDSMDRLSNRMDGLLRAREELVKLTSSPEYNAKLADVFGNGKTMLSGLMAQMTERGQPNGVVEFYGPSAYKANGGIKTGGNVGVYGDPSFEKRDGLIYRIDWKPDFAIEKKNVEAIGGLLDEIVDALNNPESKNYLTDPLARASYERVFNYVAKFLVDNRYLTEQQWGDSLLLKGMKLGGNVGGGGLPGVFMSWGSRLYTTRMNAAKASGGRGGVAWEEANKAVDSFEKKSENTLRDTRTENAVARRAAIESHQLNPDDPMDVETWSAHNSLVLGSMQNPSQDQLREGDYVGGLQVTKEDIRSTRIQKQFSTGVVVDFNNMATSFAEVVNPEEEIGGILFTRAAEDYGMKTRREFSLWGREFSDLWKIATEKDLKAFRVKQDSATGDEPVGMVWDEREKLANHKIEGPVYSHIAETNSEFTSKDSNQLKAAFSKIRKDLKAGRSDGLRTVNDIASEISDLTAGEDGEGGLNPLEAKEELLKAIDRDVTGYLRASDDFSQSDIGGSNLPNAIMSVKAANGALAKARGKMVAPSWFYDYGIHDDYKRAGEVANGKRILLMKVYETMTAYRGAVKRKLDDAKREIRENAAKMGRDGKPVGLAKAEKEYDRKMGAQYNEGSVFATRLGLEETLALVDGQLEGLKAHLAGSSRMVVEKSLAIRGAKAFIGGFSSVLLSNGNSIINNLTSTTLDTYRTWQMTNRYGAGLMAIARANGRLARFIASDLFSNLPASLRRGLTKRRKIALLDTVAKTLEGLMGERRLMEASGLIPSFESYSSIYQRIKANPLTFGVTRAPATGTAEKIASKLYSKAAFAVAMGSWVRERSPGYFDSLLNRVIATDANQFTEWLTPHLLDWARSLPGETVQEKFESAGQSTITPESMGVTKEGLALIRDYMSGAGSLETIAQRALQANGLSGLTKPNVLSSEERVAVQFDAGRKYNTRASSTSPDTAKGGAGISGVASNVLHMFMGWVLQRMGSDATQFLKFKGGGWKKELEVFWKVIQLFLVTLMAGALYKVPKDIWRFITGNPATTPNILQAIESPEMGLRYLAAATAGVLPLGAEIAAELMGGTGISSPLNNNFLDNNPIAGFMASVLASGKRIHQTGDLKYPLVDFARKNFWPAGAVMNYTMEGDVEARGAARAVRMGAGGMEVRPVGGGVGARETPTTPLVRDAVSALYEGNSANYQKARDKFISYQIGQGKTQNEAERRFDSSVSGRDPLRSVLGRTPTEDEEATILRRLTPGQRATVTKARSLFRKPKKIGLGRLKTGRKVRLGRKRPSRRRVRLRRAGA